MQLCPPGDYPSTVITKYFVLQTGSWQVSTEALSALALSRNHIHRTPSFLNLQARPSIFLSSWHHQVLVSPRLIPQEHGAAGELCSLVPHSIGKLMPCRFPRHSPGESHCPSAGECQEAGCSPGAISISEFKHFLGLPASLLVVSPTQLFLASQSHSTPTRQHSPLALSSSTTTDQADLGFSASFATYCFCGLERSLYF